MLMIYSPLGIKSLKQDIGYLIAFCGQLTKRMDGKKLNYSTKATASVLKETQQSKKKEIIISNLINCIIEAVGNVLDTNFMSCTYC